MIVLSACGPLPWATNILYVATGANIPLKMSLVQTISSSAKQDLCGRAVPFTPRATLSKSLHFSIMTYLIREQEAEGIRSM